MNFHLKINYYMLLINYFLINLVFRGIEKYDLFTPKIILHETCFDIYLIIQKYTTLGRSI